MHKQTTIKTCIIIAILVIVGFGCNFSFAAGDTITTAGSEIKTRTHIVYYAVGILSWARFIPAKIAGMFLTNTRVYGEAIGFDSYLWLCRNVVKNISNFIL
ncbi:MAG: hypothetical protein LBO09_06940 [Candidatus Peribacteria bacterium]|jgi:hypothetical protein|nr:hypothetical protein [Candidatus Peribacteria bacterium]